MSRRLRNVIIVVVTAVWALNFCASVLVKNYTPSESINGIFMVIVGGLYATDRATRRDDENSKDEKPKIGANRKNQHSGENEERGGDDE